MIVITILLFCFAALLSFLKFREKTAKTFFLFIGVLLFLVAAFRNGDAVRDYDSYLIYYKNIFETNVELSFTIISWIVEHVFFDNAIFLFVIYAMIGVTLKMKAIKTLTTLGFLSVLIYISTFYILHEFTQIRAGVAAGFVLLCIKPIYERNLKKFILFACCAVLFHYSALIVFLLWFFKGDKINKYVYAAIIPLAYGLYFFQINLVDLFIQLIPIEYIQRRYDIYLLLQRSEDSFANINVFNYVFLAKCLIFYVLLWKSKLIEAHNRYVNLLLKIEALSLICLVLLSAMPIFAFRLNELLGIVEIILIPFLYYVFEPKFLSKIAVVLIGLCLLLINIFYANLITF